MLTAVILSLMKIHHVRDKENRLSSSASFLHNRCYVVRWLSTRVRLYIEPCGFQAPRLTVISFAVQSVDFFVYLALFCSSYVIYLYCHSSASKKHCFAQPLRTCYVARKFDRPRSIVIIFCLLTSRPHAVEEVPYK